MDSFPTLDNLIRLVEDSQPGAGPLQQLTESVILSGRLSDVADDLVGHFVEDARASGATWAEIGECMGVSKQAAQKRFNSAVARRGGGFFLTRFATPARQVVRRAVAQARDAGASHVGTEHLVLGLIDDPDSLAVRAIAGLGVSVEEIRAAAESGTKVTAKSRGTGHVPFSGQSKKVLELALRETIRSGSRRIGTEHILLGILRDRRSPGARLLIERGVDRKAVEAWLENQA
ncbi:MAG: Clp protease N-terminal domain-containing protein [Acidimicrobiia bacterium]